ncbi:MAG TPA: hypothetical protein VKZ53_26890, partial [Candidatus Angelobacter sp.]|nr:hypothetical protein [Candidatus Angelobacter sp.]
MPKAMRSVLFVLFVLLISLTSLAQEQQGTSPVNKVQGNKTQASNVRASGHEQPPLDLSKGKTLFVVGYAHLDTQWRWEYPQVIQEYLSKTMRTNFALFEKYPHYIFN